MQIARQKEIDRLFFNMKQLNEISHYFPDKNIKIDDIQFLITGKLYEKVAKSCNGLKTKTMSVYWHGYNTAKQNKIPKC